MRTRLTPGRDSRCGVYIHIPFCHSKCYYCDFCSRPPRDNAMMASYVDRVKEELHARVKEAPTTVYIGGGTPSILPAELLKSLAASIDTSRCEEFTIEANPEDVTPQWVAAVRECGIGRVSMGVQSLSDRMLHEIGRRHTATDAIKTYHTLRDGGIGNISLDLIYGLPGLSDSMWSDTLAATLALQPDHLSCYLLSYEPGTRLYARRESGKISETDSEACERQYDILCKAATEAGFRHYEISNFALPGKEAVHNSSYWDSTPYIGIGAGAHSFDGEKRYFHRHDPLLYIKNGYTATLETEEETADERFNDFVITRLRTAAGLSLDECSGRFGNETAQRLLTDSRKAVDCGHIVNHAGTLVIPEKHWLITDAILIDLIH